MSVRDLVIRALLEGAEVPEPSPDVLQRSGDSTLFLLVSVAPGGPNGVVVKIVAGAGRVGSVKTRATEFEKILGVAGRTEPDLFIGRAKNLLNASGDLLHRLALNDPFFE